MCFLPSLFLISPKMMKEKSKERSSSSSCPKKPCYLSLKKTVRYKPSRLQMCFFHTCRAFMALRRRPFLYYLFYCRAATWLRPPSLAEIETPLLHYFRELSCVIPVSSYFNAVAAREVDEWLRDFGKAFVMIASGLLLKLLLSNLPSAPLPHRKSQLNINFITERFCPRQRQKLAFLSLA